MDKKIVIVGAGVAGLTLGYSLAKQGRKVSIIEKNNRVGGLARSFQYNDLIFDIGPKRFHTDDENVLKFIFDILEDNFLVIPRSSSVYLFNKYFSWPLSIQALLRLPVKVMIKSAVDLFAKDQNHNDMSFSAYTKSKYGKTLYELFFKPYTEKFLRIPCDTVHADWAKTGVNRAVIDKRVKNNSLFDVVMNVLLPKPVKTNFIYPSYGGMGSFCEKLKDKAVNYGADFLLANEVQDLEIEDGFIKKIVLRSGEKIKTDYFIWSGNLLDLFKLLKLSPPPLKYLSTIFFNMKVEGDISQKWQWCYYGTYDTKMVRVSMPKMFASYASPKGISSLIVELTCYEGDSIWQNPMSMLEEIKRDLKKVRIITNNDSITDCYIEKVCDTYPVYDLNYQENYSNITKTCSSFKNLRLLGRTGTYWYNNLDHSIKMAMDMSQTLFTEKKLKNKDDYFKF